MARTLEPNRTEISATKSSDRKQTVRFFQRKRRSGRNFSLEQIFDDVRKRIQDQFEVSLWEAPYLSNGLFRRLWIGLSAAFAQRDLNHVTGDINFATLFMRRQKTVLTILDCGVLERTKGLKRLLIKWIWFQIPAWRCRFITVISNATRDALLKEIRCTPERIRVIPVAISPGFVKTPKEFCQECPEILHVGTAENKNLLRLAQAIRGLKCRLKIVGPLNDALLDALKENEIDFQQVQNLSHEELISCYQDCDMVSFVSTYEGFGMPILEANATGRVVVTSNVTSMPEVAGDAACLVDPFDIESISKGIQRVINEPGYRSELIANGYRNVERFEPANIADQYVQVYEQALNG